MKSVMTHASLLHGRCTLKRKLYFKFSS